MTVAVVFADVGRRFLIDFMMICSWRCLRRWIFFVRLCQTNIRHIVTIDGGKQDFCFVIEFIGVFVIYVEVAIASCPLFQVMS
jgi:hypothetical protein